MKKLLAKIVCMMFVLALSITALTGCSDSSWSGTVTLKNSGNVLSNGGFIAETENYIYFINGIGVSTSSNKMGEPLKGALMVADKNDLTKSEVVVPKLMVASDYNMGVFIDGGYAYYGTPNVEKNASGYVAKSQMTFMRTKLDGSGTTDVFFTIGALSTEYRIVKAGNTVYIYYVEDNALHCYNTSNDQNTIVIEMNSKAEEFTLDKVTFVYNKDYKAEDGVVAYFTSTVYAEKYDSNAAQNSGYQRRVATYNRIYAVVAGNNTIGEPVVTGQTQTEKYNAKYQITLIKDGYLFYTETVNGTTTNYAIELSKANGSASWFTNSTKIVNSDYVKTTNLFDGSLEKVYVLGENNVYETTATSKDAWTKRPILTKDSVKSLLFVREEGGVEYLYYINTSNNIAKINLATLEKEIRVSDSSAETTWYMPEIITVGEKDYLFYCDNSLLGKSYIEYIDLSAEIIAEDTDEDEVEDLFYLDEDEIKSIGKMTDEDKVAIVAEKINALTIPEGNLGDDAEKDAEFIEEYNAVLERYNALDSLADNLADEPKTKFANIKKAFDVIEEYKKLDAIRTCNDAEEAKALGLDAVYESVKAYIEEFKSSSSRDAVDGMICENLKANYTKAVKFFEE